MLSFYFSICVVKFLTFSKISLQRDFFSMFVGSLYVVIVLYKLE